MGKKLFIGSKLRRFREQQELSQSQCAERLGLSHSYLNQLENNQRPVTASVLIKLSRIFGIEISQLSDDDDKHLVAEINLSLKDESLGCRHIRWQEIEQFVQQQPQLEVPSYLRNAPTKLMEQLGHGQGYRYAHTETYGSPAGSAHDCWPDDVPKTRCYEPSAFGQEKRFGEIMAWREQQDLEADQAP